MASRQAATQARQPKQGEPPQVRMKVTERQRELMVDYLAFLRQSARFSQSWARWKRIHSALMRSATLSGCPIDTDSDVKRWRRI